MSLDQHPIYLVVQDSIVVADDIAETIREFSENAEVTLCRSLEEARDVLARISRVDFAVLPRLSDAEELMRQLAQSRTRIIVTSDGAPDAEVGPVFLPLPFTGDMLKDAIRRAGQS
ncbi:hypothetical protein DXV76_04525 [Rhodobacteraceae bacterium CCMM004]|nr:hypothetical protein DXV76_04525 [Rhodobacteraceae bacterium CCMM004]